MKVTVKISGFEDLIGSLGLMDVSARTKLAKAVDHSSANILAGAQERVPVGGAHDPHPGELKKTLRRKISRDGLSAMIMAGYGEMAHKGGELGRKRSRGAKVNEGRGVYAPAVEFGSMGKPEHPFLRPARDAEAGPFVAACGEAMKQVLDEPTKKSGRGA
jgi:HK97 gp10 family phage protein